jgi:hypothetical protein
MKLLKVVKRLAKKSARRQTSRSIANRARPHLEALETRMALADLGGGGVLPPPPTNG